MPKKICPLLNKFGILPGDRCAGKGEDWFTSLCHRHCKIDKCVLEWGVAITDEVRDKLNSIIIPCPKCYAKDKWWEVTDEGVACVHCGMVKYKLEEE